MRYKYFPVYFIIKRPSANNTSKDGAKAQLLIDGRLVTKALKDCPDC